MEKKPMHGVIESWIICTTDTGRAIAGYIYRSPRVSETGKFADGHRIFTSDLITPLDEIADGVFIETINSIYHLGCRSSKVTDIIHIDEVIEWLPIKVV